jgi:hypothetical protein
MKHSITYEDSLFSPLDADEVPFHKNYYKLYWENDTLVRTEGYNATKLIYTRLLNSDHLPHDEVLLNFNHVFKVDIVEYEPYGTYKIETSREYHEGILKFWQRILYNGERQEICSQDIDINTGQGIPGSTEKRFEKEDNAIYCNYYFSYDGNGNLARMTGAGAYPLDSPYGSFLSAEEIQRYFPDFLLKFPYYKDADFLPGEVESK